MAWSTRELAALAGTSLRTVRHYHEVGLLPEPERRSNGYKQYGVAHLVRLLRVKRLADLGFSLPRIAELGDQDEHPGEALRELDAELAAQIERLQHLRGELAQILAGQLATDLPVELARAAEGDLSAADRSFVAVMGRVLDPVSLQTYGGILAEPPDEVGRAFDALPADADDQVRDDLAERMAVGLRDLYARHPGLAALGPADPRTPRRARDAVAQAMVDLYNPAQLDVLRRLRALVPGPPSG